MSRSRSRKSGKGYSVDVSGNALDARSLVRQFTAERHGDQGHRGGSVSVSADVKALTGFHDERLSNVKLEYSGAGERVNGLEVTARPVPARRSKSATRAEGGGAPMRMQSADAGAILRFLDIYEHMEGGKIDVGAEGRRGRADDAARSTRAISCWSTSRG